MKYEKSCGCIVIDNGKVLLIQHNLGHWDFPKGHVEGDETEVETAIREVKEETNIDVIVNENYRYTMSYSPEDGVEKEVVYFIASKKSDDLKNQESEVQAAEWVDLSEAVDRITYDNSKEIMRRVIEDLRIKDS
ncbi:MAG: NUDIX domain-containing protein [Clostridia bacterium]|nr:NUDIX domain-containing protein [Clostridia bacterium]